MLALACRRWSSCPCLCAPLLNVVGTLVRFLDRRVVLVSFLVLFAAVAVLVVEASVSPSEYCETIGKLRSHHFSEWVCMRASPPARTKTRKRRMKRQRGPIAHAVPGDPKVALTADLEARLFSVSSSLVLPISLRDLTRCLREGARLLGVVRSRRCAVPQTAPITSVDATTRPSSSEIARYSARRCPARLRVNACLGRDVGSRETSGAGEGQGDAVSAPLQEDAPPHPLRRQTSRC